MTTDINVLTVTRNMVYNLVKDLPLEAIHYIPNGFNNNIAWNITHLVVTQQLLHYNLSGLDCLIPEDLIDNYKKGTKPNQQFTQQEWEEVLTLFIGLPETLKEDFQELIFTNYNEYATSTGFVLKNIEDAIAFNNYHEGIHFGSILAIRRLLISC